MAGTSAGAKKGWAGRRGGRGTVARKGLAGKLKAARKGAAKGKASSKRFLETFKAGKTRRRSLAKKASFGR